MDNWEDREAQIARVRKNLQAQMQHRQKTPQERAISKQKRSEAAKAAHKRKKVILGDIMGDAATTPAFNAEGQRKPVTLKELLQDAPDSLREQLGHPKKA